MSVRDLSANRSALAIRSQGFTVTALALVLALFAMGNNFSDYGLPSFITAARLGYAILGTVLLTVALTRGKVIMPSQVLLVPAVLCLVALISFAAVFRTPYPELVRPFSPALDWMPLAITFAMVGIVVRSINGSDISRLIRRVFWWSLFLYVASLVAVIPSIEFQSLPQVDWWGLRHAINDSLSTGLNRFLTGLLLCFVCAVSLMLGYVRANMATKIIAVATIVSISGLYVLTGSRQNIFAAILFLAVLFIVRNFSKVLAGVLTKPRMPKAGSVLFIASIVSVAAFTAGSPEVSGWIGQRLISQTQEQAESGSARGRIYAEALSIAAAHPVLGIGPGTYHKVTGYYPHNGYLGIAAEIGIIALCFVVLAVVTPLIYGAANLTRLSRVGFSNQSGIIPLFTLALCYVTWSANWNDLVLEPFFWTLLAVVACFNPSSNRDALSLQSKR